MLYHVFPQWWWRVALASLVYLVVLGLVLRPRQEEVRIFQAVLKRKRKRGGGQPEATPPADGGAAPTV